MVMTWGWSMALAEKHMNNSTDDFFGEMTRDYYIG